MTPPANTERYKNHHFPSDIIRHGVWLSYRFTLSYRAVQELLCERGIEVPYAALCPWCLKSGQDDAHRLRCRRAQPGDTWHRDAVFFTINGKRHDGWRAGDQDANVRDLLGQNRRHKNAAQ